jgi:hypothetical protein
MLTFAAGQDVDECLQKDTLLLILRLFKICISKYVENSPKEEPTINKIESLARFLLMKYIHINRSRNCGIQNMTLAKLK